MDYAAHGSGTVQCSYDAHVHQDHKRGPSNISHSPLPQLRPTWEIIDVGATLPPLNLPGEVHIFARIGYKVSCTLCLYTPYPCSK